jgi:hypothetical protein
MALAVDAISNSGAKTSSSGYTWSHTCTGTNLVLIVCVTSGSTTPQVVTGITYNSVALTQAVTAAIANARSDIWYLKNPSTGANTISVTLAGTATRTGGAAVSFTGADQSNPIHKSNSDASSGTPSVSVTTTVENTYLVASLYHGNETTATGGGQTSICLLTFGGNDAYGASYKALAAATSGTMSYTVSDDHSLTVVAVQEVQGSPKIIII